MSTTTGDAEDYERLNITLGEHRDDTGAWLDTGQQLKVQRQLLGYPTARGFSEARDINYKLVTELEGRKPRTNVTLDTVVNKIAPAYGITYQSFGAALNGGRIVPLDAAAQQARLRAVPATPAELPAADGYALSPAALMALSPELAARALPHVSEIDHELARWRVKYAREHPDVDLDDIDRLVPPGGDLFGPGTHDAQTWDARKEEMPVDELVSLIAALRALASPAPGQAELSG